MALLDDLKQETRRVVEGRWNRRDGEVVPDTEDLGLSNETVEMEATFLYADLADSTRLASNRQTIAAEVFKAYLLGTTRVIRALGGEIRSFDGDRVMGVFNSRTKNTSAAEAGLKINYFFSKVLKPAFQNYYGDKFPEAAELTQTVGIDTTSYCITLRKAIMKQAIWKNAL